MKTVLITGIAGQDGSYMADLLFAKGYRIVGTIRDEDNISLNLSVSLVKSIELIKWDMLDQAKIMDILSRYQPSEIYNFAALHLPATDKLAGDPIRMGEINGLGVARMLQAICEVNTNIRFCQASSGEIFSDALQSPRTLETPFMPRNFYGAAKLYAHSMIRIYRQHHGLFACSAVLFNHESPRPSQEFVTKKITRQAVKIKLGLAKELCLGNLDARRDWGFAEDYVRAMWLMLQQPQAADYIVATGKTHSVRDVCQIAFGYLGLDYRDYVRKDANLHLPADPVEHVGDPKKTMKQLGWKPEVKFEEVVKMMVDAELQRSKQCTEK